MALYVDCEKACRALKITNEDGIYAFCTVSFMIGGSLQGNPDYLLAHRRYILLGYDAGQLPIDILRELSK